MKAYVIKNKEGKYFAGYDNHNVFETEKNITNAVMYRSDRYEKRELETAPEFKDCEIVEITIAESDLEKQLAEKDKEIEELRTLAIGFEENFTYTLNQKFELEKENKQLRHQVCEEIREFIAENWDYDDFKYFLDQIEQGESK